ncbi:MAG: hypothetical protein WD823_09710, partial [Sulfuricaulis sp.]|uniref:hypothetical protein n=1 Tax=Sulfuricaulis sp. TaxID=2003553 RepID=UPI0034A28E79
FFARTRKSHLPWVSHPQVIRGRSPLDNNNALPDFATLHPGYKTLGIAHKTRDAIQTLDPGLRRDDERKTLVT